MYKSIIVPVDGSRFAEHALPYALELAKRSGGTVHIVHALAGVPPTDAAEGLDLADRERRMAASYVEDLAAKSRRARGVSVEPALVDGAVVDALRGHATAVGADLVVMTTHGRTGWSRMWLGSVADEFIRTAERPVLLVRGEASEPDLSSRPSLDSVLVPLDGSERAESILDPAARLANGEMRWNLVRVEPMPHVSSVHPAADYMARMLDEERRIRAASRERSDRYLEGVSRRIAAGKATVTARTVFEADPAGAILQAMESDRVDVVALATRGRGSAARLFLGSVADKVIRAAGVPVLVYRP